MTARKPHIDKKPSPTLPIIIIIIASLTAGCSGNLVGASKPTASPEPPATTTSQTIPLAKIQFEVAVPDGPNEGKIELEIVDEVTGLAMNPQRYPMDEKSAGVFSVEIPIQMGSVLKYRYIREGNPDAVEYTAAGNQVRYRMATVNGPALVLDIVSGWTDFRYSGPTGRITGQVIKAGTNEPIPNALVTAGGAQTLTASDGTFLFEGLPPGTHNLVAFSIDGSFAPFQQGALVAENASTPAVVQVTPAPLVKVTFIVQIPESNVKGLPVRLIGNITSLGNTFADLDGGFSVIAARAPLMTMVTEGVYSLTLDLPSGLDLRYKYTLGDGFWNAEHSTDGSFKIRQLIVPTSDYSVTDIIDTWKAGEAGSITFTVQAPDTTPTDDVISIQFNPYGWTAPIPMWPLGNHQWVYVLYSPFNMITSGGYRYCRNDLCGSADDSLTVGASASGRPFTVTKEDQTIEDAVQTWIWWSTSLGATTIIAPEIKPRGNSFKAGLEFSPQYSPFWQPYIDRGINNTKDLGANWVILTPTWHYSRLVPPVIEPVSGVDPFWQDTAEMVQSVQQTGLQTAIFPRLDKPQSSVIWKEPINDAGWWQNWFGRYRTFILNYADLAQLMNAPMMIIGGAEILPAIPGGKAQNGDPSGVPANAGELWKDLITDVRGRYSGQIAWALPYPRGFDTKPEWINDLDLVYVLFSAQLTDSATADEATLQNAFGTLLDQDIYPLYEDSAKPVIIAVDYPSADGAGQGCIQANGVCLDFYRFSQPQPDVQEVGVNLTEQAKIYGAALNAVYERDWISGFISRGYYPPAALQDKSSSVHGKPAADILWYWFPKLLGK